MKLSIFAIKDYTAELFSNLQLHANKATAIRSFTDQVNNGQADNLVAKYPEQFGLYQLGVYDDNTGFIEVSEQGAELVIRAVDVKNRAN